MILSDFQFLHSSIIALPNYFIYALAPYVTYFYISTFSYENGSQRVFCFQKNDGCAKQGIE
jgi:hypothetical protein